MKKAFEALRFKSGHSMKNRFALAPMTNQRDQPWISTLNED